MLPKERAGASGLVAPGSGRCVRNLPATQRLLIARLPRLLLQERFYQEYISRAYTLGREQTPEDIANAMLLLVSEESRNVTGYTIYVDGGHKIAL